MNFTAALQGDFITRLEERMARWRSASTISSRLTVPDELEWWIWQEYGVPAHPIDPVEAKKLAFPGEGGTELRDHVDWPGIRAHHTVGKALDDIRETTQGLVTQAFQDNGADDPAMLGDALEQSVEAAKQRIVEGMAEDLPGTRPINEQYPKQSGKLGGESAASVFADKAEVVRD